MESLITPSILRNKIIWIEEMVYAIAIKNLLQAEFLQVVPVSLLQPKDTICCWACDTIKYESRQSGDRDAAAKRKWGYLTLMTQTSNKWGKK